MKRKKEEDEDKTKNVRVELSQFNSTNYELLFITVVRWSKDMLRTHDSDPVQFVLYSPTRCPSRPHARLRRPDDRSFV